MVSVLSEVYVVGGRFCLSSRFVRVFLTTLRSGAGNWAVDEFRWVAGKWWWTNVEVVEKFFGAFGLAGWRSAEL